MTKKEMIKENVISFIKSNKLEDKIEEEIRTIINNLSDEWTGLKNPTKYYQKIQSQFLKVLAKELVDNLYN